MNDPATGNGGSVIVTTPDLTLTNGAKISSDTGQIGNGGNITIQSDRTTLTGGSRITVNTSGIGNAGELNLQATESISLTGSDPDGMVTTIETVVQRTATGNGGRINLNTQSLTLREGGSGYGGNSRVGKWWRNYH